MREVIHEDRRLEETVLQVAQLAGLFEISKVVRDSVFVLVGRAAGVVLDAPFRGREALYACGDACVY